MASERLGTGENVLLFADSRFGAQAVMSLRSAFLASRHPMLIADDHRRWITGNAAASELLGLAPEEIPWHRMDDFTPPGERGRLTEEWQEILAAGGADGWYDLYVEGRGPLPVEHSVTINVLPNRHLSVFIAAEDMAAEQPEAAPGREATWRAVIGEGSGHLQLTAREREVMSLVASGLQTGDMAERLFLSAATIKTHVQNAMAKLGARTRAHAVAIALITGQVVWDLNGSSSPAERPNELRPSD